MHLGLHVCFCGRWRSQSFDPLQLACASRAMLSEETSSGRAGEEMSDRIGAGRARLDWVALTGTS